MEFTYSTNNRKVPMAYATFRAMNTVMELLLVYMTETEAKKLCERTRAMVEDIEGKLSRHIDGSAISLVNASTGPVVIDKETCTVLRICEAMRQVTDGYFDIAAMSGPGKRPAYYVDAGNNTAELAPGGVALDLGGFAKGYALDKIKTEFRQAGVTTALVNFGNSSVMALGSHPFGESWSVATDGGAEIRLRDNALSVSGKTPGGRVHIVDPKTGEKPDKDETIAVQGTSALICEILSTALYAAPDKRKKSVTAEFPGYSYNITRALPRTRQMNPAGTNACL